MEKLCPKCGDGLFYDNKTSDGLIHEFLFCETCQVAYDENLKIIVWVAGHFNDTAQRFKKILELLTGEEWATLKNWFDYTQNVSDEYMTDEELKVGKLLGFTK